MAWMEIDGHHLLVRFSPAEHVLGLVRDLVVPLSSVESVDLVGSWREVRGLRVGLDLPRVRKLGTWYSRGHRQLVSLRRGVPALKVSLRGERYDEVLVSVPETDLLHACLSYRP
ncbi:hypothetical protein SAMN05192576_1253 [Nocardioides szechwanensis]|uniref:Uncharacterized protein n=1 Tax=Nocardioides szechwanensis TaxID=1005944 RepID=A0A1G9X471_9ACTN|nr:hypothetical protein [Nocardioides szechwanensis]SDM91487.1 hypothetical protein SAMN05192576_1253 [Nocardioides szechwanensis]